MRKIPPTVGAFAKKKQLDRMAERTRKGDLVFIFGASQPLENYLNRALTAAHKSTLDMVAIAATGKTQGKENATGNQRDNTPFPNGAFRRQTSEFSGLNDRIIKSTDAVNELSLPEDTRKESE